MKHTYVLIGNFGSGKTEVAINMSLNASEIREDSARGP